MDLSKDLGDFKSNVIALMSTVTGVVTTSDIKSTFNAKTKQYYAVKFEGLSSDDIDALNTNASSVFESSLSGSVDKISSKLSLTKDEVHLVIKFNALPLISSNVSTGVLIE